MMKPSLAFVVAHYHPTGRVPEHLRELVRHLRALTDRIVFVSTGITDAEADALAPSTRVIRRPNFGYDFWSYKVGIDALGDLSRVDRLVILNSSFVTLHPKLLLPHFTAPVTGPRLRGLSECLHPVPHLQSYCVSFEHRSLLSSEAFRRWWTDMTPLSERAEVIAKQELGLSAHFRAAGVPIDAVYRPKPNELAKGLCRLVAATGPAAPLPFISGDGKRLVITLEHGRKLNPTHFMWDAMVMRVGILKIELLRDNPMNLGLKMLWDRLATRPAIRALVEDALIGEAPRTTSSVPTIEALGVMQP